MIRMTPSRRTILQCSQRALMLGLTLIVLAYPSI
jgi:hypothetical protein